jgi:hypothetical protein
MSVAVDLRTAAAALFAAIIGAVVLFQLALAAGASWGEYAMGGRFRVYPVAMRVAALIQAGVLVLLAFVELSAARIVPATATEAAPWLVWLPVVVSAVALLLNVVTPSVAERRLWAPVATVMLLTSLIVAVGNG